MNLKTPISTSLQPSFFTRHKRLVSMVAWLNIAVQVALPIAVAVTPSRLNARLPAGPTKPLRSNNPRENTPLVTQPTEISSLRTRVYSLGPGENVQSVAKHFNMTTEALHRLNRLRTFAHGFYNLRTGDELDVPLSPLPEVKWEDPKAAQSAKEAGKSQTDEQASRVAGYMSQAGSFLGNHPNGDAAGSMARGIATGKASSSVEEWLGQFGTARVRLDADGDFSLKNSQLDMLIPLWERQDLMAFTQGSIHRTDDRAQTNIGFGLRHFSDDYMLGANTFFDYDISQYHYRAGFGLEYWRDYLKLSANSYLRLSDWRDSPDVTDYEARPANGWDIRTEGYLPAWPHLGGTLKYEQYYGNEVALFGLENRRKNPNAVTAGINYTPFPLLTLSAEQRQGQGGESDTLLGLQFTLHPDQSWSQQVDPGAVAALRSLAGSRHDLVERNNNIILEYRKKELIRLKMAPLITGYGGEQKSLGITVNSKYGYAGMEWSAAALQAAGGQLVEEGAGPNWSVVLPPYQYAQQAVNTYILSAVALDSHGNRSQRAETQITVNAPVVNAELTTFTPADITLPADGISTQLLTLTTLDDARQPVDIPVSSINVTVTPTTQQSQALRAAADATGITVSPLARVAPGVYETTLSAGTLEGAWLITPSIGTTTLAAVHVSLTNTTPDATKSTFTAGSEAAMADGQQTIPLTLTALNTQDQPVKAISDKLKFVVTDSNGVIPSGVTTGAISESQPGIYTAALSGTQAGEWTVTPQYNGAALGDLKAKVSLLALPDTPTNLAVTLDGTSLRGNAGINNTITVTYNNVTLGTGTVNAEGVFTVPLVPAAVNGEILVVTATDSQQHVSAPATVTAPDTTSPLAPTDLNVQGDGLKVTGKAEGESGGTAIVTGAQQPAPNIRSFIKTILPGLNSQGGGESGEELGRAVIDDNGLFSVPLNPAQLNGQTLYVHTVDKAGLAGMTATVIAPDVTAPEAPGELAVSADGLSVVGKSAKSEVGTTVTVSGTDGGVLGLGTVRGDATFTVTLSPAQLNGQILRVTLTDQKGNTSAPGTVNAPDTTGPVPPTGLDVSTDGQTLTGKGEPGGTVAVIHADGTVVGTGDVAANGSFSVTLNPPQQNGEILNVIITDASGNTGSASSVTAPDAIAPAEPQDLTLSADGRNLTGKGEPGSTVNVANEKGVVGNGTVGADNNFSVTLNPAQANGETLTVTIKDKGGNVSEPGTVVAQDTTAPAAPTSMTVSEDGLTLSGEGEPGGVVTARNAGGTALGDGTVSADGTFSVTLNPAQNNGETLTVIITDKQGNVGAPGTVVAQDASAPAAPTALVISPDGLSLSGEAEPGGLLNVTNAQGAQLGTGTVEITGRFNVTLSAAQINGETLSVTVADITGNVSAVSNIIAPDTTAPAAPTALTVSADGLSLSGGGEAGGTVNVTNAQGAEVGNGAVGTNGTFTVTLNPAQANGETLTVTITDKEGNIGAPGTVVAQDTTAPAAPGALVISADGMSLSGDGEPEGVVNVTSAQGTALGAGTVNANGTFSVTLNPAQSGGESLNVTVTDAAGNVSATGSVIAPDTTAPAAPTALAVTADGLSLSGKGEANGAVTVTHLDGALVGRGTAGTDGAFTVTLSPAQSNGETLNVTVTDAAGNISAAGSVISPDTTAPAAPTAMAVSADGLTLTGKGEAGGTVSVARPGGAVLGNGAVDADGNFSVTLTSAVINGEELSVTVADKEGNVSPAVSIIAPDTTAPAAPQALTVSADGRTLTGKGEVGGVVNVAGADGVVVGNGTVGAEGAFTVTLNPAQSNGETLSVTVSDRTGNVSPATTVVTQDTSAPAMPTAMAVSGNGLTLTGKGEAGGVVSVARADGAVVGNGSVGADGNFSVTLTTAMTNGEALSVTVTDKAGNVSAAGSVTAPDTTPPSAPTGLAISAAGTIVTGRGEAAGVVTVTAPGNVNVGTATVATDGNFSVTLTAPQSSGEQLSVTVADRAGNRSAATTLIAPNIPVAGQSTFSASPGTLSADNVKVSTLTLTAKNAKGGLVTGLTTAASPLTLNVSPVTGVTLSSFTPVSGSPGVYTATIRGGTAGTYTLNAMFAGAVLKSATVTLTALRIEGADVNGVSYPAAQRFPRTGFNGATFTLKLSDNANPTDYNWSSSTSWANVNNAGQVTFISQPPAWGENPVKISVTSKTDGNELASYSFTVGNWFRYGPNKVLWADAQAYCTNMGFNPATRAVVSNAVNNLEYGSRIVGYLWEWGNLTAYSWPAPGASSPYWLQDQFTGDFVGPNARFYFYITTGMLGQGQATGSTAGSMYPLCYR